MKEIRKYIEMFLEKIIFMIAYVFVDVASSYRLVISNKKALYYLAQSGKTNPISILLSVKNALPLSVGFFGVCALVISMLLRMYTTWPFFLCLGIVFLLLEIRVLVYFNYFKKHISKE